MKIMQCPYCSNVVQDGAAFCPTCNARLSAGAPAPDYAQPAPEYAPPAPDYAPPAYTPPAAEYAPPVFTPPVPSYAVTGSAVSKQSAVSIAGFILALIGLVLVAIGYILAVPSLIKVLHSATSYSKHGLLAVATVTYDPRDAARSILNGTLPLLLGSLIALPGMSCCIVGCALAKKKKVFAVIGLVLSVIILLAAAIALVGAWFYVKDEVFPSLKL